MKQISVKKEGTVWYWEIVQNGEVLFGGYCRTKKDALSDANIVLLDSQ